jgi:hypothetical protein
MNADEEQKLKFVAYSQRYTAAWPEISQRVSLRQNVHLGYATLSISGIVTVLGWAENNKLFAEYGAAGLVIYSWAFAFWIRNNHALVGLLGVYCKALEGGFEKEGTPNPDLGYAWHTDSQGWIVVARRYGWYSDWASTFVAVLASVPAWVFGFPDLRACETARGIALLIIAAGGIGAAIFSYWNRLVRDKIASLTPADVANKGRKWKPN